MKRFKPLRFPFVLLLVFAALLSQPSCATPPPVWAQQDTLTIKTKTGPLVFHVEYALTQQEQMRGLMNRKTMPEDSAMLFVFGKEDKQVFWMKDTLIPLDMLFIAKDGTIRHIHSMAKPLDESEITSERPVLAVLEINGGMADKLGIANGDKVIHPAFRNQLDE